MLLNADNFSMEETKLIIKAVFIYPLTKSLKYQHERLSKEPDKYDVIDVDNPIEAGQVLSMEQCGVLFCSDSKKVLKCLEKYEKLFSDSKFRIILVLPKRIMGKELVDLSNKGVQDIIIDPVTEKSLTAKVDFNFSMIKKLIDAAIKAARRKEELNKAREEAIALKKLQDEKRKLKIEERLKQAKKTTFWDDKDKAAQALMFKPVEGKIKDGADNINALENSATSLNALDTYNNAILNFEKTIKDKISEIEEVEKTKKKVFDFDGPDQMDSHLSGDQKNHELDSMESVDKKTNSNNFLDQDDQFNLNAKTTGNGESDDNISKTENSKNISNLNDNQIDNHSLGKNRSGEDSVEMSLKKSLNNFEEQGLLNKEASSKNTLSNENTDGLEKSQSTSSFQEDEAKLSSQKNSSQFDKELDQKNKSTSSFEEESLKNNNTSTQTGHNDQLASELSKNMLAPQSENITLAESSKTNLQLNPEDKNQKSLSQFKDLAPENNQLSTSLATEEHHDTNQIGQNSSSIEAQNLQKGHIGSIINNEDTKSEKASSVTESKNQPVEAKGKTINQDNGAKKTSSLLKDQENKLDKNGSSFKDTPDNSLENSGALKEAHDANEKSNKNLKINLDKHEKSVSGQIFDGEIKKETKFDNTFVDEFTKAKRKDVAPVAANSVKAPVKELDPYEKEINAIVFDSPPQNIIKANLHSIDAGLILLQKLSTSEQKIEEQSYVFPFIAKKMYEMYQGLASFYVIDSKGAPTLLHSSHNERKEFYDTFKLPPIDDYVAKSLADWAKYRYATLNDDTLHSDLIEMVYPFKEGSRMLGIAIIHCYKTIKETSDVNRLEMLIEFTRGYFLRFHNIGAQSSGKASTSSSNKPEEQVKTGPWYQKYIDGFNSWLNKAKAAEGDASVTPIKQTPKKKGAA